MFIRFRLRCLGRRIECVGRWQGLCMARFARLSALSRRLTYRRRFLQNKLDEAVYATTLRGWLRAIFRRPGNALRERWTGSETPPAAIYPADDFADVESGRRADS